MKTKDLIYFAIVTLVASAGVYGTKNVGVQKREDL
jgi:hypothetical protein